MMEEQELLKLWKRFVGRVGRDEALAELIKLGVSPRTAGPLVAGTYKHSPSRMLRKHLRDLIQKELKAS